MNETGVVPFGEFTDAKKAKFFIWTFILILSVLGNMAVIWRVVVDHRLRTPTFILLACMAFADFLYPVIMVPISSISIDLFRVKVNKDLLYFLHFLNNAAVCSAANHLVLLSMVRYGIIVHPLKSRAYLTNKRALAWSFLTWVFSGVIQGTVVFVTWSMKSNDQLFYSIFGFITVYLIPLLMISIINCVKLKKFEKYETSQQNTRHQHERRLTTMIYFIIILYAVLCLPRFVFLFVKHFKTSDVIDDLLHISAYFHVLNSCLNPIVYVFQSPVFLVSLKRGFGWHGKKQFYGSQYNNNRNYSVVFSNSGDSTVLSQTSDELKSLRHSPSRTPPPQNKTVVT